MSLLRADLSINCGSDAHEMARYFATIMVLLYPVGIPLIFFWNLFKNREAIVDLDHRDDHEELVPIRFLYKA